MHNQTQTRNTVQSEVDMKPEDRQEVLRLHRVDVLDLQDAIFANQMVPITHSSESRPGVPFSALND